MDKILYKEFFEIVKKGDEAAAREFLVANIKSFPQETQDAIIFAFFQEALEKKQADDALIADFHKKGFAAMNALEKVQEEIEKQMKLAEIKESL